MDAVSRPVALFCLILYLVTIQFRWAYVRCAVLKGRKRGPISTLELHEISMLAVDIETIHCSDVGLMVIRLMNTA